MSATLREQIIKGRQRRFKDVPVELPNGPATIRVKSMKGQHCLDYQDRLKTVADVKKSKGETPLPGDDEKVDENLFLALTYCCYDIETDTLIFHPEDEAILANDLQWAGCVRELTQAMIEVGGKGKDMGKSSSETGTTPIVSGSPGILECPSKDSLPNSTS